MSKRVGSTKKRVHPNVTQQYTPYSGYTVVYTVKDGEVSLSKTVDDNLFKNNSAPMVSEIKRVNPSVTSTI